MTEIRVGRSNSDKVLEYLKTHPGETTSTISKDLGIRIAAVHKATSNLVKYRLATCVKIDNHCHWWGVL